MKIPADLVASTPEDLSSAVGSITGAPATTPMAADSLQWDEQQRFVERSHQIATIEQAYDDLANEFAVRELQNADLRERLTKALAWRQELHAQLRVRQAELAQQRQQAEEAERAQSALEASVQEVWRSSERHAAKLQALAIAFQQRVEAIERQSDSRTPGREEGPSTNPATRALGVSVTRPQREP